MRMRTYVRTCASVPGTRYIPVPVRSLLVLSVPYCHVYEMASVFLLGRQSLGKQNEQSMAKALAKVLVKCEGNNSPKYDGKIWKEEIKYIVDVNG